ncbi:hypothetical protein TUBRATIS_29020 [Tubulinosema ratisbonensis]|uniref:Uncharacterized protein n=1 Tax=Tubulinosema ratisbonensis TaxID=291195 RepID=A0A437AHU8_9MICR|nr:hypothetical protein TUBRATIS_29020 [Tubulinosema ratisbonensis]
MQQNKPYVISDEYLQKRKKILRMAYPKVFLSVINAFLLSELFCLSYNISPVYFKIPVNLTFMLFEGYFTLMFHICNNDNTFIAKDMLLIFTSIVQLSIIHSEVVKIYKTCINFNTMLYSAFKNLTEFLNLQIVILATFLGLFCTGFISFCDFNNDKGKKLKYYFSFVCLVNYIWLIILTLRVQYFKGKVLTISLLCYCAKILYELIIPLGVKDIMNDYSNQPIIELWMCLVFIINNIIQSFISEQFVLIRN